MGRVGEEVIAEERCQRNGAEAAVAAVEEVAAGDEFCAFVVEVHRVSFVGRTLLSATGAAGPSQVSHMAALQTGVSALR